MARATSYYESFESWVRESETDWLSAWTCSRQGFGSGGQRKCRLFEIIIIKIRVKCSWRSINDSPALVPTAAANANT
eukprot:scaffold440324_cov41-Prasinocladus_malaysianus.AAC.2